MNPISLKATLPSGGICFVGHALPIDILAANGSSSKLPGIKLSFNMTLVLNANGENFTRRVPILAGKHLVSSKRLHKGRIPNSIIPEKGHYVETALINVPADMEPTITLGTLVSHLCTWGNLS